MPTNLNSKLKETTLHYSMALNPSNKLNNGGLFLLDGVQNQNVTS